MKRMHSLYGWGQIDEQHSRESINSSQEILKFSLVIPTYNQGNTIEDTLVSILNQDYKNIEIIVIDGGSTDETCKIIESYKDEISYFVSERDGGQSEAINKGFSSAKGDVLAWINSDDYYLPGALSCVASAMAENPRANIIVGSGYIVTRDNQFLKEIPSMSMTTTNLLEWQNGKWIMQQSIFWRSDLWRVCGGVDESLDLLMDYDLWFRFAKEGYSMALGSHLAVMRYYPEVKSVALKKKNSEELAYVYAKNSAYKEVRRLVRELVDEKERISNENQEMKSKLLYRLSKRLKR